MAGAKAGNPKANHRGAQRKWFNRRLLTSESGMKAWKKNELAILPTSFVVCNLAWKDAGRNSTKQLRGLNEC